MRRRSLMTVIVPVTAAIAVAFSTGAAASLPARTRPAIPPACLRSFNPYTVSLSMVRSCGDVVYPLQRVHRLRGGGKAYVYDMHGTPVTIRVAPRRFHPLTATDAQLRRYGYPVRPAGRQALARWTVMMRHIKPTPKPPAYLISDPLARTTPRAASLEPGAVQNNPSWAGNVATASSEYNQAIATYNEPISYHSQCSQTALLIWVGIGNMNPSDPGGPLVQEGTGLNWPTINNDQAWWEDWPANDPVVQDFSATPGEPFTVDESYNAGELYFFWYNNYTGGSWNAQASASLGYNGNSAEMMIEKNPDIDLTNFESFNVTGAEAAAANVDSGEFVGMGELAHADYQIVSQSTPGYVIAYPGATSNSGQNWTFYQRRCY